MANYGRMDIMSMSDEEIERILNEEEKTLEDYEISLLFEELRNRRERAFSPEELPDEEFPEEPEVLAAAPMVTRSERI